MLRLAFAASLAALLALSITGVGRYPVNRVAVLASSSAPFAASSPATTQPTAPTAPTSTVPPATTLPSANTGKAWASPWFVGLIGLTAVLGVACLWPLLARRPKHAA